MNKLMLMDKQTKYGHSLAVRQFFPSKLDADHYIKMIVNANKYLDDELESVKCSSQSPTPKERGHDP